jgi:pyruvate dehydrogenase E1 component alpha subunit/2-oxoisovalerate dehydrogenase E1 component alpha subunit
LVDRAVGYGIEGVKIDGTSLPDCVETVREAVARARSGHGPHMIEATLLRLCGHGEHDDATYVSAELKSSPLGNDCLKSAEDYLIREAGVDRQQFQKWRRDAVETVERVVAQVQREPGPDPYVEDWCAISSKHLVEPAQH